MADVPGTVPVRPGHELNLQSLNTYLESLPDVVVGRIVLLSQFQGGQSNPTYYLKDDKGAEFVLRKKPPGKLLPSAIEREYRVLRALSSTPVPVPPPILLCTNPAVLGTPFYIMRLVRGRVFRDIALPDMLPQQRTHIYLALIDTLAKIHNVDINAVGLSDFGSEGNFFERQISRWARQYEAAKTKDIDAMNRLGAWLPKNIPDEPETTLVHGDFRLENCIFHPTEPRVIAVLDWELATVGHPYADLGYLCMPYHLPKGVKALGGFGSQNLALLGIPDQATLLARYAAARNRLPPSSLGFYLAFSLFRGASILQGVAKRAEQGNAANANASSVGAVTELLAQVGWKLAANASALASIEMETGMFPFSRRAKQLRRQLMDFMEKHVYPNESVYADQHASLGSRWQVPPIMEELKAKAKKEGLWNLFLPSVSGLSNLDYAPLCEIMGRSFIAPEVFNCNAPDTGNMEVLERYGTPEQKKQWLEPLLQGEIRSCFAMTEPGVASSDATNIRSEIRRDGNHYVINGRKWWTSGAGDPRCKLAIFMGKTDANAAAHKQQSMILVPMDAPGVEVVRHLPVFGYDDAPHGHMEVRFTNVRVPASNLLLGEGRGFEISQGRLGPGRIHHCMRVIGLAERCLELMLDRIHQREAFGKKLAQFDSMMQEVARSRLELDQARLLTLKAAHTMDIRGNQLARDQIAAIKVVAPNAALHVIDRAIQAHGGAGVSDDFMLAYAWAGARTLRLADGPDEVHLRTVAQEEYRKHRARL